MAVADNPVNTGTPCRKGGVKHVDNGNSGTYSYLDPRMYSKLFLGSNLEISLEK